MSQTQLFSLFGAGVLLTLLAGGLILDVPALARLHELGLGEHAGFAVRGPVMGRAGRRRPIFVASKR